MVTRLNFELIHWPPIIAQKELAHSKQLQIVQPRLIGFPIPILPLLD